MTDAKKSFLKHTILGLLTGGAVSAAYAMLNSKEDASDPDSRGNDIVVPLSRRNFLKAVRPETLAGKASKPKAPAKKEEPAATAEDVAGMSPKDLAALKKSLIRKAAEECSDGVTFDSSGNITKITVPSSDTVPVRRVAGAGSTYPRDEKGRFVSDEDCDKTTKSAGMGSFIPGWDGTWAGAGNVIGNNLGLLGGMSAGLIVAKLVSDRIMINKKKRQVELARRRYVDALNHEVNDEDLPYYTKAAQDNGVMGSTLGYLGLAGLLTGSAAAAVMYRIMENRRKEIEKAKDKDLAKYPMDKSIRFRFPKVQEKDGFFR